MTNQNNISQPLPELKFERTRTRAKFCPCGKNNNDGKFAPYVGYDNKGYCHSCGETFLPLLQSSEMNNSQKPSYTIRPKLVKRKIDYLSLSLYVEQLKKLKHLYSHNNYLKWLSDNNRVGFGFDHQTVTSLIEMYFLGNSEKYKGWILFPYIDIQNRLCDIKAMDYNPQTGKRISIKNGDQKNRCFYIGKYILNDKNANTVRSFFGEHLLKGNTKIVLVFESEATALYMAPFYPDRVCIATGGSNGVKFTDRDKWKVLKGRKVILHPDLDAHDAWEANVEMLRSYGLKVTVSQLIKDTALRYARENAIEYSELVKGKYDLRDIFKYKNLKEFLLNREQKSEQKRIASDPQKMNYVKGSTTVKDSPKPKQKSWILKILLLEMFFASAKLPKFPVKLRQGETIQDVDLFIKRNLEIVIAQNGNLIYLPYLNRLQELSEVITNLNQKR